MNMDVDVAVIGDEGVGKSSLILSATQRSFKPGEPVTAQPGTSVKVKLANAECKCICHDTTSRNMEEVNVIIRNCDVVLLCFSMAGPMSLHSAIYTWLPHIIKIDSEIPILMVGCREDQAIVTEAEIAQLDASINQAVNLVRYDKCSAMHPESTAEVFRHACDACVNPVLPLYHHVRERLRCKAIRAFNRIFDIADEDRDGALSDVELNRFHVFAFGRPPRMDELNGLKQALMERAPDSVTTLGVTRSGFMQLQAMMIQQERLDICWNMLRNFGYNRQLHLDPAVYDAIPAHDSLEVCMLSAVAVAFLKSVFQHRCTPSKLFPMDLLMQDTGPSSLFHNAPPAVCDDDHPLGRSIIRPLLLRGTDTRYLPLESFLGVWAYCTMINPRRAVMAMMYLGYPDGYGRVRDVLGTTAADKLLVRAQRRKLPNLQPVARPVDAGIRIFSCLLFGSPGCGKSNLLQLLSACPPGALKVGPQQADGLKAARLIPGHGRDPDTLLVIHEISSSAADDLCISAAKDQTKQDRLLSSDIMLFGFDSVNSDSYAQARSMLVSLSDASNNVVPVALVGLKADLGVSSDITSMAATDCHELKVRLLRGLSAEMTNAASQEDEQARVRDWAFSIVELACHPGDNIAMTPSVVTRRIRTESMWRYVKYITAAAGAFAGLGIAYQVYHHMSLQSVNSRDSPESGRSTRVQHRAQLAVPAWK